jgi:hypothetical protein
LTVGLTHLNTTEPFASVRKTHLLRRCVLK